MLEIREDIILSDDIIGFEESIFVTKSMYIRQHVALDMCYIGLMERGIHQIYGIDALGEVHMRRFIMKNFNRMLANRSIDVMNGGHVSVSRICLGVSDNTGMWTDAWLDDYFIWLDIAQKFASADRLIGFAVHANELTDCTGDIVCPHVHVIYEGKGGSNELTEFIQASGVQCKLSA